MEPISSYLYLFAFHFASTFSFLQLNAFSGLSSLNSLDLSYCKQLQKIDEHAFEIRSQLRHFDLSHCSLRSLSEALIDWNRLNIFLPFEYSVYNDLSRKYQQEYRMKRLKSNRLGCEMHHYRLIWYSNIWYLIFDID